MNLSHARAEHGVEEGSKAKEVYLDRDRGGTFEIVIISGWYGRSWNLGWGLERVASMWSWSGR